MAAMRADRLVADPAAPADEGTGHRGRGRGRARGVSERTARRDLEALGMAGVPDLLPPGPQRRMAADRRRPHRPQRAHRRRGPCAVPRRGPVVVRDARGQGRAAQARARAARDVPPDAEAASTAIIIDPVGWDNVAAPRQAARAPRRRAARGHRGRSRSCSATSHAIGRRSTRVVHPLGLATKGTAWYLVADTDAGLRTFRVDRMTSVEPTGERVVRPPGLRPRRGVEADHRRGRPTPRSAARATALARLRRRLGPAPHVRHPACASARPPPTAESRSSCADRTHGRSQARSRGSARWSRCSTRPKSATSSPASRPSSTATYGTVAAGPTIAG